MERFENGQLIQKTSNNREILIMIAVIWMIFSRFFYFVLSKVNPEYFLLDFFKYVNALISIIWGIIPLLLAFSVKDKNKQVFLFVLAGVYILMTVFDLLQEFIPPFI